MGWSRGFWRIASLGRQSCKRFMYVFLDRPAVEVRKVTGIPLEHLSEDPLYHSSWVQSKSINYDATRLVQWCLSVCVRLPSYCRPSTMTMTFHNQNKENLLRLPSFSSFSILNHPPTNLWVPPKKIHQATWNESLLLHCCNCLDASAKRNLLPKIKQVPETHGPLNLSI